jgi:hypothetical protein
LDEAADDVILGYGMLRFGGRLEEAGAERLRNSSE